MEAQGTRTFSAGSSSLPLCSGFLLALSRSTQTVESWLDERGDSLVPLSNPGSDPEVSLGSG